MNPVAPVNSDVSGVAADVPGSVDAPHVLGELEGSGAKVAPAAASQPPPRRRFFQRCISAFDQGKGCVIGSGLDSLSGFVVSKGRKFDASKMDIPSEDTITLSTAGNVEIVCLADGHGGFACSHFMASHLVRQVKHAEEEGSAITGELLDGVFCAADQCWQQAECCDASGTTATMAIVSPDKLTIAHVGDSSALCVTVDGDGVLHGRFITKAHVASDSAEAAAVEARGGCIEISACDEEPARVNGELEVTRALGDLSLKPYVSSSPDVFTSDVTEDMVMLIIASDGLWDQVSIDEVLRECKRSNPTDISQQLAKLAYAKNGRPDDISVYTRFLNRTPSRGPVEDSTPLSSPRSEPPSTAPPTPPLLSPRAEGPPLVAVVPASGNSTESAVAKRPSDVDGAIIVGTPGIAVPRNDASTAGGNRSPEAAAAAEDAEALARVPAMSVHLTVAHVPGTPGAASTSFLDTASAEPHAGFESATDTVVDLRSALDCFSAYQQHGRRLSTSSEADRVALAKMWLELQEQAAERVAQRSRRQMLGSIVKWGLCVTGIAVGGVLIAQGVMRNR